MQIWLTLIVNLSVLQMRSQIALKWKPLKAFRPSINRGDLCFDNAARISKAMERNPVGEPYFGACRLVSFVLLLLLSLSRKTSVHLRATGKRSKFPATREQLLAKKILLLLPGWIFSEGHSKDGRQELNVMTFRYIKYIRPVCERIE